MSETQCPICEGMCLHVWDKEVQAMVQFIIKHAVHAPTCRYVIDGSLCDCGFREALINAETM